jgi:protein-tyrosine phosphatase
VRGLVDLHCHILPALDDGALDLRDAVGMGRQADADGIATVCATPHIRSDHDVRIPELAARRAAVNAALGDAGLRVRVAPGGEVAEPLLDALSDAELRACALGGGGRWILLEPAAGPLSERTHAAVERLHAGGFDVLLAHPERHMGEELFEHLRALAAAGVLIQLTAAFAASEDATAMLEAGLVHVLGSDAHSSHGGRPLALAAGLARIARVPVLAPHLEWIARTAPRAIVAGRPVTVPY